MVMYFIRTVHGQIQDSASPEKGKKTAYVHAKLPPAVIGSERLKNHGAALEKDPKKA